METGNSNATFYHPDGKRGLPSLPTGMMGFLSSLNTEIDSQLTVFLLYLVLLLMSYCQLYQGGSARSGTEVILRYTLLYCTRIQSESLGMMLEPNMC